MAETAGVPSITCELSIYQETFTYVRIQSQELAEQGMYSMPGRAVVYRDGRIISTIPFDKDGRFDQNYSPNKLHQYSLGWINQQGELAIAPVFCGSITPPSTLAS